MGDRAPIHLPPPSMGEGDRKAVEGAASSQILPSPLAGGVALKPCLPPLAGGGGPQSGGRGRPLQADARAAGIIASCYCLYAVRYPSFIIYIALPRLLMSQNYSVLMSVYYKEHPDYLRQSMQSIYDQTVPTDNFVLVCTGVIPEFLLCRLNRLDVWSAVYGL